jgi:ribosomal protein S17E
VTKQKATYAKDFLGEKVAQSPQIETKYLAKSSCGYLTKLVKNKKKKAWLKGKEKKRVMLYLVTTKLNT